MLYPYLLNSLQDRGEIHSLDLTFYKDEGSRLHTTLYRKPTDHNSLLHYRSFHPYHQRNNIPYGQFQRLRKICDCDSDYHIQSQNMSQRFLNRSYKKSAISAAQNRAAALDRQTLLQPSEDASGVYFSTIYSLQASKIKQIINSNWDILRSDPFLKDIFQHPPTFCYRKAPSLKDKLSRSYLPARRESHWLRRPKVTFQCL